MIQDKKIHKNEIIDIREWFWHLFSAAAEIFCRKFCTNSLPMFSQLFVCLVARCRSCRPRSIKNAPLCYSWQLQQFAFAAAKTAQLATLSFYHQVMI